MVDLLESENIRLIYTIKAKAVSGVTLLDPILPSDKTENYPPMPLIYTGYLKK
jgi:hypothetical protein